MNTKTVESIARKLPLWTTRIGKRLAVRLRSRSQLKACRKGFEEFGDQYPQPILFIAGLPKSGSTWIEKMVSSYQGFHEYLPPEIAAHELATGGSHDFEIPKGMFDNLQNMLVLTKMHSHGSPNNIQVLRDAGLHYVVLHRDLRDVAVSYHFYVQNTPWHPEYQFHQGTIQEGLFVFGERMLPSYVAWVRSWQQNADPNCSLQMKYEEMLENPVAGMTKIASLFQLDDSVGTITKIVDAHSFKNMSGGRERGNVSETAFARKGVAGDWVNHFTPDILQTYGCILADFLIETGYEIDDAWITQENSCDK